jgi:hypothetical protein
MEFQIIKMYPIDMLAITQWDDNLIIFDKKTCHHQRRIARGGNFHADCQGLCNQFLLFVKVQSKFDYFYPIHLFGYSDKNWKLNKKEVKRKGNIESIARRKRTRLIGVRSVRSGETTLFLPNYYANITFHIYYLGEENVQEIVL